MFKSLPFCILVLVVSVTTSAKLFAQHEELAITFRQAQEAFQANNYPLAESLLIDLVSNSNTPDSIYIGAQVYLGSIYGNKGNLVAALQSFNAAQALAELSKDKSFLSRIYYSKSLVFLNTNQLDSSKLYLLQWQGVMGESPLAKATSYQMLADCSMRENRPEQELQYVKQSINVLETIEQSSPDYAALVQQKTLTSNYNRLCFLFLSNFNNADSAYYYSQFALDYVHETKAIQDTILFSLYEAVYALQLNNQVDKAKRYLLNYLDFGLTNQWYMGMNEGYRNLHLIYRIEDNADSCIWSLDQMIDLGKSTKDYNSLFWAYTSKVDYLRQFGEYNTCVQVAKEAVHLAKTIDNDLQLIDSYLILGDLLEEQAKYAVIDSAYQLLKSVTISEVNAIQVSNLLRQVSVLYELSNQLKFEELAKEMIAIGQKFNNEFIVEDGLLLLLDHSIDNGQYAKADSLFNAGYQSLEKAGLKLVLQMQMFYNEIEDYERSLLYAKQLKKRALAYNSYIFLNAAVEGENIAYNFLGLKDSISANKNRIAALAIPDYEKYRMLSLCFTFLNTDSAIFYQKQVVPMIKHDKELLYFAYSKLADLYHNYQADSFTVYYDKIQEICDFSDNCAYSSLSYLSQDVTKYILQGDIQKADSLIGILSAAAHWNMNTTADVIDYMSLIFFKSMVEYIFKPLAVNAEIPLRPGFFEQIDFSSGRTLSYFSKLTKSNQTEFLSILDGFNQYKYNKPPAFRKKLNAFIEYYYQLMSLIFETTNDDNLLKFAILYHDMSKGQILYDVMNADSYANNGNLSQNYLDKLFNSDEGGAILSYNYMVSWPNDSDIPFMGTINYLNGVDEQYGHQLLSIGASHAWDEVDFKLSDLLASSRGASVVESPTSGQKSTSVFGDFTPSNPLMMEANDYILQYNNGLRNPAIDVAEMSKELFENLLSVLDEFDSESQKLNIIPHNQLYYIPFETLIDESGRYLVENHDISYAPSIAVLRTLQSANRRDMSAKELSVFITSISDYSAYHLAENRSFTYELADLGKLNYELEFRKDNKLQDLYQSAGLFYSWNDIPATKSEAEAISNLFSRTDWKQDSEATESAIKAILKAKGQSYDVLHFATHGISLPEANGLSALVLQPDEFNDGFLRFDEIMEFDLNAKLVVLSACETGDGEIQPGEGLINLGYAFISAGAQNAIVSMWPVDDAATSIFMQSFYALLKENPNDIAYCLAETKRSFIHGAFGETYTDPYFWAPFVLFGE